MGFADLHIHSIYSYDGTCSIPAILKEVKKRTDLNVIAITDHDTIRGNQLAMELAPHYGLEVIPGCEVSTADGHLLALWIDRPIKPGRSLVDTALEIADQGGVCIAAHPMARGTHSLQFDTIWKALQDTRVALCLVGIEAFNGGLVYTRSNPLVAAVATMLPIAKVGNSDAHVLPMIGCGSTEFAGTTAKDLLLALKTGKTTVRQGKGLGGFDVLKTYIPRYILRKIGWVAWNDDPQAPLKYVRLSRAIQQSPLSG
ncbi:MAG TPA: PHP domain-containing protein [Anaerolineaceae bacterium]|nr:PHP domain-containing protein [Anaerolineaceae bacterium]